MLEKAARLFEDGYRAEEILHQLYRVTSPTGQQYVVDLRDRSCECQAFRGRQFTDTTGRTCCKHTVGTRFLLAQQKREAEREAFVQYCFERVEYVDGRQNEMPVLGEAVAA
jgi:hypothetical protein